MLETTQEYKEAIARHEKHHIFGAINTKSGERIYLEEDVLKGEPSYKRQCTLSEDEFGIGQMYTGTANITADLPGMRREDLRGGTLWLEFRAGQSEFITLGSWTITDPRRDASGYISITAADCISKLDVPINDNYVGAITLESRMEKVTELTGVTFAQTPREIYEMIGGLSIYFGSRYRNSCRAEVAAIAQLIGGFACDDRNGRIIFKKFGKEPVISIPADERHGVSLAEYTFGLRGIAYDNGYGHTTVYPFGTDKPEPNTAAVITLSGNPYMDISPNQSESDIDRGAKMYLKPIAENLNIPDWTPGRIEYYGDPALELGDMITITGGINGEKSANFLITAENWQFRGAHTLISSGAFEGEGSPAAGAPKTQAQQIVTEINVTKSIAAVELKGYEGVLTDVLRTVAEGGFSCREETVVFVYVTANTAGLGASEVRINVLYDGVKQTVHAVEKSVKNGVMTIHFALNITASAGSHTVSAEASGNAEIQRITACVWGQGIVGEQAVPTNAADYEYTVSGGSASVTKYIGSSVKPSVPAVLGGAAVKVIGGTAFKDSDVEFVYIPEGVEKIL